MSELEAMLSFQAQSAPNSDLLCGVCFTLMIPYETEGRPRVFASTEYEQEALQRQYAMTFFKHVWRLNGVIFCPQSYAEKSSRSTEDEFLDRIFQESLDDIFRLAYAEWLEAQRDPRGDLIRFQCRLPSEIDLADPRHVELKAREEELLSQIGPIWTERMPAWLEWNFRRGFRPDPVVFTAA